MTGSSARPWPAARSCGAGQYTCRTVAQLPVDRDLLRRRCSQRFDLVADQQLEPGLLTDLVNAHPRLQPAQPHPAGERLKVKQRQVGDHGAEPAGRETCIGPAVPAGEVAGAGDEVDLLDEAPRLV